jgi:amidase
MNELLDASATELSRRIRDREVSCREVMTATLDQVARLNPQFNALVSLQDAEQSLAQADAADALLQRGERQGFMHGFPLAVKDLSPASGFPTTLGSPLFKNNLARRDALFVERMKKAGALVIGKSNTPEFGLGSQTYNPLFGTTLNAFDPSRTAGGSSGGAAVAIALRMLPLADGSDMGGSLRNPAAFNNIYGLRPTYGRVPSLPTDDAFFQQLGTEGPMGRSPEDVARLLAVQAGRDARAPLSLQGAVPDADTLRIDDMPGPVGKGACRIGWLGGIWPDLPLERGIVDLCRQGLKVFADLGHGVDDARLDFPRERNWLAWTVLRQFITGGKLAGEYADTQRRALLKPEAVWEIEAFLALSAADVHRATVARSGLYQAMNRLFETFDVLAVPTAQVFPFDAATHWPASIEDVAMDTYHRWMEIVTPMTLCGVPALSVPLGFNDAGLPMGMQLVGRSGADFELLALAHRYHEATQWPQRRRPPAA